MDWNADDLENGVSADDFRAHLAARKKALSAAALVKSQEGKGGIDSSSSSTNSKTALSNLLDEVGSDTTPTQQYVSDKRQDVGGNVTLLRLCQAHDLKYGGIEYSSDASTIRGASLRIHLTKSFVPNITSMIQKLQNLPEWKAFQIECQKNKTLVFELEGLPGRKILSDALARGAIEFLNLVLVDLARREEDEKDDSLQKILSLSLEISDPVKRLELLCQKLDLPLPAFEYVLHVSGIKARINMQLPQHAVPHAEQFSHELVGRAEWQGTALTLHQTSFSIERNGFWAGTAAKVYLADAAFSFLKTTFERMIRAKKVQHATMQDSAVVTPDISESDGGCYISCVQKFCEVTWNPYPTYEETCNANKFGCSMTLKLTLPLSVPIILLPNPDGVSQSQEFTFGSRICQFSKKKSAKHAAAKKAYEFLINNELLTEPESGPVTAKTVLVANFTTKKSPSGSTQEVPTKHEESPPQGSSQIKKETSPSVFPQDILANENKDLSDRSRVEDLVRKLGLGRLRLDIQQIEGKPCFYNGAAYLPDAKMFRLRGPLGEVDDVYGKKTARQNVYKGVRDVLEKELDNMTLGVFPSPQE